MSRNKALDMIKKRAAKFKELRTNTSRSMDPNHIMLQYVKDVEEVKRNSEDALDYDVGLNKATTLMDNRLRAFDVNVHIHVQWSKENEWENMSVTGIRIIWSDKHIAENPDKHKELTIDLGKLFMEGLFDV